MVTAGIWSLRSFREKASTYANIPKDESVLEIGLYRAVALIVEKQSKMKGGGAAAGTELRKHPKDESLSPCTTAAMVPTSSMAGPTRPSKDSDPKAVTLEEAIAPIDAKKEKDACEKIR